MTAHSLSVLGNGQDLNLQSSLSPCLALGVPKPSLLSAQVVGADVDTTQECTPNTMMLATQALDSEKQGKRESSFAELWFLETINKFVV